MVKGLDADKVEKSSTVAWERIALQVGIVKAVSMCLRSPARFIQLPFGAEDALEVADDLEVPEMAPLEDCRRAILEARPAVEAMVVAGPSPAA